MLLVISFAQLKSSLRLEILYKLIHVVTLFLADKCNITGSLHKLIVKPLLSHSGCQSSYILPSELPVNFSAWDLWFTALSLFCRLASAAGRVRKKERLLSLRPQSCLKIVPKLSQSWVKVESKLSQRSAGCVRTQEGDCRLPDLASRAAAGQCYRCQSATAATNTVLQLW